MKQPVTSTRWLKVHPLIVRYTHWINAGCIVLMVLSGWRIYNASPIWDFKIPKALTLGGWLGGALQWHFAIMWLLVANGLLYLIYSIASGHLQRHMLPVTPKAVLGSTLEALRGKLEHVSGEYNAVQRLAYLGVMVLIVVVITSGLAVWKPVQLQELAALFGGFEGARKMHFIAMSGIVLFVIVHVAMVTLVPRTFLPMITGRIKVPVEPAATPAPGGQS